MKLKLIFFISFFTCLAYSQTITTVEFSEYLYCRTYYNIKQVELVELKDIKSDKIKGFKIEKFYILTTVKNFDNLLNGSCRDNWECRTDCDTSSYVEIYVYSLLQGDNIKFYVFQDRRGRDYGRLIFSFILKIKEIL